jgi:hypothetical protein
MKKRSNYKQDYEKVYLLDTRLKTSFSKESENFLESDQTQRVINHLVSVTIKKNYWGLKLLGIERDDILNVSRNLSAIFYSKYWSKQKNERAAYYALCRFLGQKLNTYISISTKKMRPVISYGEYTHENESDISVLVSDSHKFNEIRNEMADKSDHFKEMFTSAKPENFKKMEKILVGKPQSEGSDLVVETCLELYFKIDPKNLFYKKEDGVGYYYLTKQDSDKLQMMIENHPKRGVKKLGELIKGRTKTFKY